MSNYNHIGHELVNCFHLFIIIFLAGCYIIISVTYVPSYTAHSEVRLTQQSPMGLPCSGEEVILQCTLQGIAAIWTFPGGEFTLAPGSIEVITGHFQAQPVGVANGEFTSTLTFPAVNGTVIICSNGDRSMDDTRTITVQGILTNINKVEWHKHSVVYKCKLTAYSNFESCFREIAGSSI